MTSLSMATSFDGFHCTIGEAWLQGRTAYGGASAALALAAAKALLPELPPLVSAQIAFVGPLSGECEAKPVVLRQGRNSVFVGCDLHGSAGVALRALFLFMAERPSSLAKTAPPAPTKEVGPPLPFDARMPQFLANFDMADAGRSEVAGWRRWVRLRKDEGFDDEGGLLLLADALPPAAMALSRDSGPVSTTTWQLNVVGTPQPATAWHLLQAETLAAGGGTSSQVMAMWDSAGRPLASATQSVALFY